MRLGYFIASKLPSYKLSGEVEVDQSYFSGVHKGKRVRELCRVMLLPITKENTESGMFCT